MILRAMVTEEVAAPSIESDFSRLVSNELAGSYHLAGYLLGNAADGQDATQEAVERAWLSFRSLRDHDRFEPWFRRIVVNICRDRLRRRRRILFLALGGEDAEIEAADPFALSLSRDALGRALDCLSADERVIVVLHYWSDLTTREIAELLTMRQGTVKSKLHDAYGALRRRLERDAKEGQR